MRVWTCVWLIACGGGGPSVDGGGDDDDDATITTPPPTDDACVDRPGESWCDGNSAVVCADDGSIDSFEPCGGDVCADGTCVGCAPGIDVPFADADVVAATGIVVEADPSVDPTRPSRLRPVVVSGAAEVAWTGPLALWTADGAPLAAGSTVTAETVWVAVAPTHT
ncbi:MAG: hypothetical protein ABMB14_38200, partial [Myxococcota bacterium]